VVCGVWVYMFVWVLCVGVGYVGLYGWVLYVGVVVGGERPDKGRQCMYVCVYVCVDICVYVCVDVCMYIRRIYTKTAGKASRLRST
jgi:hypothetical protein